MAARRVVLLLLVVLVASTLAAALLPTPPQRTDEQDETRRTTTERGDSRPRTQRRGRLVVATFEARGRPQTIRMREGDELRMEVGSRVPVQIEIAAFGLIEDASRDAPARFDLLADRRGTFPIRLVASRRTIGRLVVR